MYDEISRIDDTNSLCLTKQWSSSTFSCWTQSPVASLNLRSKCSQCSCALRQTSAQMPQGPRRLSILQLARAAWKHHGIFSSGEHGMILENPRGAIPLNPAAGRGRADVARCLVINSTETNTWDGRGGTPLSYATQVEMLRPFTRSEVGRTCELNHRPGRIALNINCREPNSTRLWKLPELGLWILRSVDIRQSFCNPSTFLKEAVGLLSISWSTVPQNGILKA